MLIAILPGASAPDPRLLAAPSPIALKTFPALIAERDRVAQHGRRRARRVHRPTPRLQIVEPGAARHRMTR